MIMGFDTSRADFVSAYGTADRFLTSSFFSFIPYTPTMTMIMTLLTNLWAS